MSTESPALTQQYPDNNTIDLTDGKKRKADKPNKTEQPEQPIEGKKAREGTFATGFLVDGTWVEDMKFACFPCKRGHRTHECVHANEGRPVGPAIRGRPATDRPKRRSPKCGCEKHELCTCLHQTYILEKIIVGTQEKWKIQQAVISDGKGRIVGQTPRLLIPPPPAPPPPTIQEQLGHFWNPQNTPNTY